MARIDFKQLQFIVEKQITKTRAFRQRAIQEANMKLEDAKEVFLEEFEENAITEEIKAGPTLETSNILQDGYGNLFSFIGFPKDTDPIKVLYDYLDSHIRLVQTPVTEEKRYLFRASVPSLTDLYGVTPMPWGTSQSWLYAIENGIPGFNKYLFDLDRKFKNSLSGPAIEVEPDVRAATYTPQEYITPMLEELKKLILN